MKDNLSQSAIMFSQM